MFKKIKKIIFSFLYLLTAAAIALSFSLIIYSNSFAEDDFLYNSKGRRNPFIPLVTPDGRILRLDTQDSESGLNLEGIIYDANSESYAIINSMIVRKGDFVGGYQIIDIQENKIIISKDNQNSEIELKKEEW